MNNFNYLENNLNYEKRNNKIHIIKKIKKIKIAQEQQEMLELKYKKDIIQILIYILQIQNLKN